jgi:hypothetical protein
LYDVTVCGWHLRSEIPFPELPARDAAAATPDITLSIGAVPDRVPSPTVETPFVQIGGDGTYRLEVPTVAAYLVRQGCEIVVAPRVARDASAIRTFVLGPILARLARQRGLLPLHAAAVQIGDAAVALAGHSRRGKSTLAAALALRGHRLLADDICLIDAGASGRVVLHPTDGRVRLWRDAAEALGLMPEAGQQCRDGQEKYAFTLAAGAARNGAMPVAAIYVLGAPSAVAAPTLAVLSQHDAATRLGEAAYKVPSPGSDAPLLTAVCAAVPIIQVAHTFAFSDLPALMRALEMRHAA